MKLLYFIRDPFPTRRPDVLTLFGECLAARGIGSDLVATRYGELAHLPPAWPAGQAHVHQPSGGSLGRLLGGLGNDIRQIRRAGGHDALVVRDKILTAAIALCWPHRRPVIYWASYPFPEEDLARSESAATGRLRRGVLRIRAWLTRRLLYRFVVPRATFVFVQSARMAEAFSDESGRHTGIEPVPMGVDHRTLPAAGLEPLRHLAGSPFRLVYLGAMDRIRRVEFLLDVMQVLQKIDPDVPYRLSLIGDASTPAEMQWLADQIRSRGLSAEVEMTGALPRERAWALARECHLGLSAIPRGPVYDVSSPTKTIEYLALGLPALVNDIPDQAAVIGQTGAGLCVAMDPPVFAAAVIEMRHAYAHYAQLARESRGWLLEHRAYDRLAQGVADRLAEVVKPAGRD